jgi:nucleoid-associated protein YgaU
MPEPAAVAPAAAPAEPAIVAAPPAAAPAPPVEPAVDAIAEPAVLAAPAVQVAHAAAVEHPARARDVRVPRGTTLTELARDYYGSTNRALLERIRSANPQIKNPNFILAGDVLHLPDLDGDGRQEAAR